MSHLPFRVRVNAQLHHSRLQGLQLLHQRHHAPVPRYRLREVLGQGIHLGAQLSVVRVRVRVRVTVEGEGSGLGLRFRVRVRV